MSVTFQRLRYFFFFPVPSYLFTLLPFSEFSLFVRAFTTTTRRDRSTRLVVSSVLSRGDPAHMHRGSLDSCTHTRGTIYIYCLHYLRIRSTFAFFRFSNLPSLERPKATTSTLRPEVALAAVNWSSWPGRGGAATTSGRLRWSSVTTDSAAAFSPSLATP